MKKTFLYISVGLLSIGFVSCEKVVDVDMPAHETLIYIDGFITNKPGTQSIKLLQSTDYLSGSQPQPVSGATVSVTDVTNNAVYNFVYQNGSYEYTPAASSSIGTIGHQYKLSIVYSGASFEALDEMKRVPAIDSITYEFKNTSGTKKEGYYAKFYTTDLPGAIDYYWIRAFRNGVRNTNVLDQYSIDGSFDANISDGFEFIYPIREGITSFEKPYKKGDTVKVTLRSLSANTYDFIEQTLNQIANGGLFARVLENVPSNVANKTAVNNLKIYGWFGTVAESEKSKVIQ